MEPFTPYYQLANDFALYTNRSIFLTGKAGTGKTTFLHHLKKNTKKQMAVVAPTGVAAINAGGTTMHSFFQLPFTPFIPSVEGRKNLMEKLKMQGSRRKVLQELELLVIDEISMVRADVLDAVDAILRHVRYRNNEPFGGVQVLFIGDMFQLSPVASEDEWRLLSEHYKSPYFFDSQVIKQQKPVYIELDKIFRQTNTDFINLLNEVRNNCLSNASLKLLQSRYNPLFVAPSDDTFITLTTHNYKADQINATELSKIKGKTFSFEATIEGDYPEKSYPTEKILELKIGARVMFLKNDTDASRRYFNGKIGIVENVDEESISIKCPEDTEPIELTKAVWENIRYTTNPVTKQIEEDELGKFIQFPLRLAWAITIHKSQGLTFEKAVIDAGAAFAPGQVYVALSRCRSLNGLVLLSKINPLTIENDPQIVAHEKNKIPYEELELQLDESRDLYRNFILFQLFDYRHIVGISNRLLNEIRELESSFNDETIPFLKEILKQLKSIQEVAEKFQHQLKSIVDKKPVDEEYLQTRIDAASDFFIEKLNLLCDTLCQSPATSDSRQNATEYNDSIRSIFSVSAQNIHILRKLKHHFSVDDYYIHKNTFILPEFSVNAYSKANYSKKLTTRQPELYHQLLAIRNKLCEPRDLPIYLVAGSQSLIEMSDLLPQTEKDLLQISGFGPAKTIKFGARFLEVIVKYCQENKLESLMHEKKDSNKKKKEKKPVGETFRITLSMFNEGKTIDEIAFTRNLNKTTIISHLERYIVSGLLNIDDFITPEKRQKAMQVIKNGTETGTVYEMLSSFLNYTEVKMFMAWLRSPKK